MRNLLPLFLLVFFLIAVQFSSGQTAEDIIDKYIDALGGKDRLDAIRSLCFEGSQDYYGKAELIKVTLERGKLKRFDIEVNGMKGYWMVTETKAGEYYPWKKKDKVAFPDSLVKSLQGNLDISDRLVNYKNNGGNIKLIRKDSIDNVECYKILLTAKTGRSWLYWLDAATYLVMQVEKPYSFTTSTNERFLAQDITSYKNYRSVDGIMFAYTEQTRTLINKKEVAIKATYYNNIEINKPVDPRLYELR